MGLSEGRRQHMIVAHITTGNGTPSVLPSTGAELHIGRPGELQQECQEICSTFVETHMILSCVVETRRRRLQKYPKKLLNILILVHNLHIFHSHCVMCMGEGRIRQCHWWQLSLEINFSYMKSLTSSFRYHDIGPSRQKTTGWKTWYQSWENTPYIYTVHREACWVV